jgi:hypothetical protein
METMREAPSHKRGQMPNFVLPIQLATQQEHIFGIFGRLLFFSFLFEVRSINKSKRGSVIEGSFLMRFHDAQPSIHMTFAGHAAAFEPAPLAYNDSSITSYTIMIGAGQPAKLLTVVRS